MYPPSWDCSCSYVSFSISCLQPGYRPCLSYNRRNFHCLDNQLKTLLYQICGVETLTILVSRGETRAHAAMQTLAKPTSLGIQFGSSNCPEEGADTSFRDLF